MLYFVPIYCSDIPLRNRLPQGVSSFGRIGIPTGLNGLLDPTDIGVAVGVLSISIIHKRRYKYQKF